jgi:GxxExxY protein
MVDEPPSRQVAKATEPSAEEDSIARQVVGAAVTVHKFLGPGLLESVYEQCLARELGVCGLAVERQVAVPVIYRGIRIDTGFRMDLVVNRSIVLEIKASENVLPVHKAQLLTYLKLSGHRLGLLINFNVMRIRDGIHRLVLTSVPWRLGDLAVPSCDPPNGFS